MSNRFARGAGGKKDGDFVRPSEPQRLRIGQDPTSAQRYVDSVADRVKEISAHPLMGSTSVEDVVLLSTQNTVVRHGLGRDYRNFVVGRNSHGHEVMEVDDRDHPRDTYIVLRLRAPETGSYRLPEPVFGYVAATDDVHWAVAMTSGTWNVVDKVGNMTSSLRGMSAPNDYTLRVQQDGYYRVSGRVSFKKNTGTGQGQQHVSIFFSGSQLLGSWGENELGESASNYRRQVGTEWVGELTAMGDLDLRIRYDSGSPIAQTKHFQLMAELLSGSALSTADPAPTYTTASLLIY